MKKEIQLVDIKSQFKEIKENVYKEWEKIFSTMHLMLGPNMKAFESEFANYSMAKYGIGVDSGTTALSLALKSMDIGTNDEVITVSFTFFATIEAIFHNNANPVLIDIREDDYTMSIDSLKNFIENECKFDNNKLINKKTKKHVKAIIPVHLYGMPAEMEQILEISKKYNLKILEDCAQAHGAEYRGKKIGSFGDASAFSFYFSKNLSALGEGGIILTSDEIIKEKAERLRLHGQTDKYTHSEIGYNSRLDEIQSVILREKLKLLDKWNSRRKEIANIYNNELKDLPLILPKNFDYKESVYHLYVIRTEKRDQLFEFLKQNGIGCGIHYPIPSHLQPALKNTNTYMENLQVSENISKEILSIPMHPHLSKDDIYYIIEKLHEFFNEK